MRREIGSGFGVRQPHEGDVERLKSRKELAKKRNEERSSRRTEARAVVERIVSRCDDWC